jgi:HAMP domain-containing protein
MARAPRGGWLRRGGLFGKFVVSFVGLVVFVLVVNGAVETWFLYRETKTALVGVETERAVATALRTDQSLSDIERHISWVTRASVVALEQRRLDYAELLDQVPAIKELVQLDAAGHEQLRSRRDSFVVGTGTDYSRDPRFTEAKGRSVWWSPVYFHGNEPFALIAMAQNAGVTVAEVNLKFLSEFVDANPAGTANSAYLVDQSGRVLAHSDPSQSLAVDLSRLSEVAAALNSNAGPITIGKDLNGRSVLTASAPVPQLNGFVFYEQPLSQAFARIYELLARVGLLLALGLLLAIGAGTLLARRMVIPIRKLQAGARELGANEFGHRIDVQTGDEVEELADHFNRMAGQLQESYTRLEQKVDERTRDLAQTVSELKVLEETGRAINSSLDFDAVLATIVTNAVKITAADAGIIYCYHSSLGVFELAQACGIEQSLVDTARFVRFDENDCLMSIAVRKREPIFIANLANT